MICAAGIDSTYNLCRNAPALVVGVVFKKANSMKKLIILAGIALASQFALAADKVPTAQQQLMGTCNTEAKTKELKGDERKAYMSSCLSDGRKRQNERMKSCNLDATGKKGDERKAFMSECLKK